MFYTSTAESFQRDYITYVCVSTPNRAKLERNFDVILPFVDRAVIVIGKKDVETEEFLSGFDNVTTVYRPWDDSFRDQYQAGLNAIGGGWMLWLDDDEVPGPEMLQSLRPIVQQSQKATLFDTVAFRCCDVSDGNMGEPSDYYREMFIAWNNQMRFEILLHQALVGKKRAVRCDAIYYHYKSSGGNLRGGCRDFFTAGVWADHKDSFEYWHEKTGQDPRVNRGTPFVPQPQGLAYPLQDGFRIDAWYEMKDILQRNHPEVKYYGELDGLIQSGEICQEFVDWAERHNAENDPRPHLHELYAFDEHIKYWAAQRREEEKSDG